MAETKTAKKSDEIKIPVKWIVFSIVLIAVIILAVFLMKSGSLGGGGVSESKARANLVDFFEAQVPGSSLTILSSSRQGSFYEFNVELDGEQFSIFVTTDGKYLVVDPIPLE